MSKTRASAPCLSLWERWPSAARTERVYKTAIPSHTELHALQAIKIFFKDFRVYLKTGNMTNSEGFFAC